MNNKIYDDVVNYLKTPRDISNLSLEEQANIITLSIHEQKDVAFFISFNLFLGFFKEHQEKSLRLNIFDGIKLPKINLSYWQVKKNIKWIKNCPLPKDEVFMRLENI